MTKMRREDMSPDVHPDEAPPDYDLIMSSPDFNNIPPPPEYEPPTLQGVMPACYHDGMPNKSEDFLHQAPPPLTFADFLPKRCVEEKRNNNILPKFENFSTVMTILNDWLKNNPDYQVVRAESIERKVDKNGCCEEEHSTIYFQSAYGRTTYVRGIRAWLVPNVNQKPVQHLWYTNVVPKCRMTPVRHHPIAMTMICPGPCFFVPTFDDLDSTVNALNVKLAANALPGNILTVESLDMKYSDVFNREKFNPDEGYWNEEKANFKIYITMLRIFFVTGNASVPQEIGFQDFSPNCIHFTSRMGKPRFEEYATILDRASTWLQKTPGLQVTNLQTIDCRVSLCNFDAASNLNTKKMDSIVAGESVSVNVLRVAYLKQPEVVSRSICLTSRAFVPVRTGRKTYESMLETVQRINAWLHYNRTSVRVIGVDTITFGTEPMVNRQVNAQETRQIVVSGGQHWLSVIRLYLDGEFCEPPASALLPVCEWTSESSQSTSSECCNIL